MQRREANTPSAPHPSSVYTHTQGSKTHKIKNNHYMLAPPLFHGYCLSKLANYMPPYIPWSCCISVSTHSLPFSVHHNNARVNQHLVLHPLYWHALQHSILLFFQLLTTWSFSRGKYQDISEPDKRVHWAVRITLAFLIYGGI